MPASLHRRCLKSLAGLACRVAVVLILAAGVVGEAPEHPVRALAPELDQAEASLVPFLEDFSGAAGGSCRQVDGGDLQREGTMRSQSCPNGGLARPRGRSVLSQDLGHLSLVVTEDDKTPGPDGRPGVLRLTIDGIPDEAAFSGFSFAGREGEGLRLPVSVTGEVTHRELERVFVSFRFRADNLRYPDDYGVTFVLRAQPDCVDGQRYAANFGPLHASRRWRRILRPISSATNLNDFLLALNQHDSRRFRLTWEQYGPIQSYLAGDGLLIDDVRIIYGDIP